MMPSTHYSTLAKALLREVVEYRFIGSRRVPARKGIVSLSHSALSVGAENSVHRSQTIV